MSLLLNYLIEDLILQNINFLNHRLFISNSILSITGKIDQNKNLFQSKSKRFSIALNGEIYNYRELQRKFLKVNYFKTEEFTDTEVLVNLHDLILTSKVPKLLNGMFAYVIYDIKKNNLIISNDVQGEKNLYYYNDDNFFIVSSTPKSILKFIGRTNLNTDVLKSYFTTRHYMPLNETCFSKINLFKNGILIDYDLKNKSFKEKIYDDPSNWISYEKYNFLNKLKKHELFEFFEEKLSDQSKLMIPKRNFGSIVSGGIDSSLQTAIISKFSKPKINLAINHTRKDRIISENLHEFEKYLNNKISIYDANEKTYNNNALKAYEIISSPMQTHDLPSRIQLSKEFKNNNCKVFFSADGCDELFGGQQIYKKSFTSKNFNFKINNSPYTKLNSPEIKFESFNNKSKKFILDKQWSKIFNKYKFLNKKERNIQTSLYLDYFIQSINVANRSNDLICCNFSIEPRNIFIQKNILKLIINLPLKYKYNFNVKNEKFMQKNILKVLFSKYFTKSLIKTKEGFSGYPNDLKKKIKFKDYKYVKEFLEINSISNNINKPLEWKFINLEIFLENYVKNRY